MPEPDAGGRGSRGRCQDHGTEEIRDEDVNGSSDSPL